MRYLGPEAEILHERYAEALFEVADEKGTLKEVYRDLGAMTELTEKGSELSKILKDPEIEKKKKDKILKSISKKYGFSEEFTDFLSMLTKNGRLPLIHGTLLKFTDLYNDRKKRIDTLVKVSRPLSRNQERRLTEILAKKLKKEVTIKTQIDRSVLGGIDLRIGNKVYNFSVSERIRSILDKVRAA